MNTGFEQMAFRGVWIPNTLWLDETITKLEMLILADILNFKNYYKNNATMMKFFNISERTLQRTLASMEQKNLIEREIIKNPETGRTVSRILRITEKEKAKIFRYDNSLETLPDGGVGCQNDGGVGCQNDRGVGCQNDGGVGCQNDGDIDINIENKYRDINIERREVADATFPSPSKKPRFQKPTVEEIQAYLDEKDIVGIDAEYFWNFYESKDWMIGKSKMKNWKACIATWQKRNLKGDNNGNSSRNDEETDIPNLEWMYDEWKTTLKDDG